MCVCVCRELGEGGDDDVFPGVGEEGEGPQELPLEESFTIHLGIYIHVYTTPEKIIIPLATKELA